MNLIQVNKIDFELFFIGTTVTQNLCEGSIAGSVAGNKFQLNLVIGLDEAGDQKINVFSLLPYPMYPKGQKIWFNTKRCSLNKQITTILIPFINLPIIKQLSVSISFFITLISGLWNNRSKQCIVLVYNVFSPFSIPVLLATRLFNCKSVAIIADLPFDDYDFKGLKGILQRIDFYVQTHIISKFSGVIGLTSKIISEFAPLLPSIVIEGGIDIIDEGTTFSIPKKDKEIICLYSGALNEINGIKLLLDAFNLISEVDFRLWILGDGPLSCLVEQAAELDNRIVYWGKVSNQQAKICQREATVLINPRPSDNKIAKYTFPSKLLEYLLSGRPVISTRLPGIPEDYNPHLIFLETETSHDLAVLIQEVCLGDTYDIDTIGTNGRKFVVSKKNWTCQSKSIHDFLITL